MVNFQVRSFFYLFLAIPHISKNGVSKSITPDDLKCICGLRDGSRTIQEIPKGCKTLVLPSTDKGNYMNDIAGIKKINEDRPIMVILNTINYDDWLDVFAKKKGKDLIQNIKCMEVDGIIFDNMYDNYSPELNGSFTKDLVNWLGELKSLFCNMKFGITLPLKKTVIYNSLNITYLNKHIDFYLLKSVDYDYKCELRHDQDDMPPMVKAEYLESNIQKIISRGMDASRLIYTIYIEVFSVKKDDDNPVGYNYDSFSYSRLCSASLSKHRKYCMETIDNIFLKARLRLKMNMLGVFATDLENDDLDGYCGCQLQGAPSFKFPELFIIAGASQENKEAVDHYKCVSGSFPHLKQDK